LRRVGDGRLGCHRGAAFLGSGAQAGPRRGGVGVDRQRRRRERGTSRHERRVFKRTKKAGDVWRFQLDAIDPVTGMRRRIIRSGSSVTLSIRSEAQAALRAYLNDRDEGIERVGRSPQIGPWLVEAWLPTLPGKVKPSTEALHRQTPASPRSRSRTCTRWCAERCAMRCAGGDRDAARRGARVAVAGRRSRRRRGADRAAALRVCGGDPILDPQDGERRSAGGVRRGNLGGAGGSTASGSSRSGSPGARGRDAAAAPPRSRERSPPSPSAAVLSRLTPHGLRHTWATLALASGVHPKVVADRPGQASVAVTPNRYSHVVEGLDRAAADTVAAVIDGPAR
jgi:hypothetical protein